MEQLDLPAALELRLAQRVLKAPSAHDAMAQRMVLEAANTAFQLIHETAHKGPIDYGNTREHTGKTDTNTTDGA